MAEPTDNLSASASDRRGADRRCSTAPFAGPDRREGARRSGEDRRAKARLRLTR